MEDLKMNNHPMCPCAECWCNDCIKKSSKIQNEIKSYSDILKKKFVSDEYARKRAENEKVRKEKIRNIAGQIRKQHKYVYRLKKKIISYGDDGYGSAHIITVCDGTFSTFDKATEIKENDHDIVVEIVDDVNDEDIAKIDVNC